MVVKCLPTWNSSVYKELFGRIRVCVYVQSLLPGYPYPSSTDLIPDVAVVAADSVASDVRKDVATALFRYALSASG